jgi:AMP nucleosidase
MNTINNGALTPISVEPKSFSDATEAVDYITMLYDNAISFLSENLRETVSGVSQAQKVRAFYPQVTIATHTHEKVDSRLAFGFVADPGVYSTTLTRPRLFRKYLIDQLQLLISNHKVPVSIDYSDTPIPIHFAMPADIAKSAINGTDLGTPFRDMFDVPDLHTINDDIVNGQPSKQIIRPLAPFTAQRIDYSLARLGHYTATDPEHFQNYILFTNYQFYVNEFVEFGERMLLDDTSGYTEFVSPGNAIATPQNPATTAPEKLPQMPAYHLKRPNGDGITLVNIGVGPSNAKTATDHIAVLRPNAWVMLGHCAGLRNSQNLGDYVLAHAYVREDHVLDADLPISVPVPALAEIQIALEQAVAEVTELKDYDLKRIMRTGTVATIDNRNWELRNHSGPIHRLSQSRAVALDMESATIAANGFRFRVPYGTLLCVSDKPLHGELKLPGMASDFYQTQVSKHLQIGIRAFEHLREMPPERLHSRKLRSFDETAFL